MRSAGALELEERKDTEPLIAVLSVDSRPCGLLTGEDRKHRGQRLFSWENRCRDHNVLADVVPLLSPIFHMGTFTIIRSAGDRQAIRFDTDEMTALVMTCEVPCWNVALGLQED